MDSQTQKTVLTSLIVSIVTTVPLAVVISFLVLSYTDQSDPIQAPAQPSIEQALEVTADQDMQEEEPAPEEKELAMEELRPNQQTSETELGRDRIARTIFTTNQAIYQFVSDSEQRESGNFIEQSIERTDLATGEKTVWVEDIRETFSSMNLSGLEALGIFSNPNQGNTIYLEIIPQGTEYFGDDIYQMNINTKRVQKLEISEVLGGHFGQLAISPNGQLVLYAPQTSQRGFDQELLFVNLEEDESEVLITLTGNETFNAGSGGLLFSTSFEWVDDENFTYEVYDQSKKEENSSLTEDKREEILIERRSYSLATK